MPPRPLTRLRKICLSFPDAHEVEAWGEPTFRVRNKLFAMYAAATSHHGEGRPAVWCKAPPGNQSIMVRSAPKKFFVPPYVGPSGWVGIYLDGPADWTEIAELLRDAYEMTAVKKPKRTRASTRATAKKVPSTKRGVAPRQARS